MTAKRHRGLNLDSPTQHAHLETAQRVNGGAHDGLPRLYVETRTMFATDDVRSDLPPAFQGKVEMGAAIFQRKHIGIDAEDQDGQAVDIESQMLAIGNILQRANIHITRHI